MKINRSELFKSMGYAGAALALAGYLRSTIEGVLSPLDMGLLIGGGALLVIAAAFNFGAIWKFLTRRSSRLGANTIVLALAVLAILTALNVLAFRHDKRFDMTSEKLYSLSDQSRKVADHLDRDVHFIYFSNEADPRLQEQMAEYRTFSRRIQFERVDPVAHPDVARQYDVRQMGSMVATSGTRTVHLKGTTEEDITNALIQLTRDSVKTVCFVTGHGEKAIDDTGGFGYSAVKDELAKESYKVQPVTLANGVPTACTVLVIAGPTHAFFPQEATEVEDYLAHGGKAFILIDPDNNPGLQPVFQAWNIKAANDTVIDVSGYGRLLNAGPAVPVVFDYGDSPITKGFRGTMTIFPLARTVGIADQSKASPDEIELLKTTARSWATPKITGKTVSFDPKRDTQGPLSLGVAVDRKEGKQTARLVVIGNSVFATNRWVGEQRNGDLFYNSISWLAQDEGLISIRPKSPTNRRVTMTASQQRTLMWISLFILPGIIVIGGIWVWWRRR
jgi:ABC-type uncharacterized transport system involved in gliding motility auxiliary subunit